MERAEAETIYDSGRDACVEFMLEMTQRFEELAERSERQIARLQTRIERLEEELRRDSRNSSKPPSSDPPKSRQERRTEARAKAKELMRAPRGAMRKEMQDERKPLIRAGCETGPGPMQRPGEAGGHPGAGSRAAG